MLATDHTLVEIQIGDWVGIEAEHFHFHVKFIFDRLSVPFVILTFVLCGTIGAFTSRYLHRDKGFNRFCVFFAFFTLGMVVSSLAGTIEVLFLGWELVGLSSALLVAFFQLRLNPVRNGLRVWSVYRIADAAFLIAALTMHHLTGGGDFTGLMGTEAWPDRPRDRDGEPGIVRRACCCCWPPRASRHWFRFPAGCRERWKARRRRVPSSMERFPSTWARSC